MRPPRIVVVAVGSRGDVQPCVALGRGLVAAGFDVVIAAPTGSRTLVTDQGLAFADLGIDPTALLTSQVGRAWVDRGSTPVGFIAGLLRLARPTAHAFAAAVLAACADADVVVYTTLGFPAWHFARARGIPAVQVSFAPFSPTAAFPPPLLPDLFGQLERAVPDLLSTQPAASVDGLAGASGDGGTRASIVARGYHRVAHRLLAQALWLPLRGEVNRWRRATLGLPPLGLTSPAVTVEHAGEPLLHAFSPALLPPPPDWGAHVTTTGSWFLARPPQWQPPRALLAFLDAGPPPISLGIGSMTGSDPDGFLSVAVAALRRTGQRGVVLGGWAGLAHDDRSPGSGDATSDVLIVDDVWHDWLFERVAAVVHHGGAGTTAAGLRAGRPSVVVPHFGDQALWATRVHAVGAGPVPVPRGRLSVDRLAHALAAATHDPRIAASARRMAAAMRAEPGVDAAVAIIATTARRSVPPATDSGEERSGTP